MVALLKYKSGLTSFKLRSVCAYALSARVSCSMSSPLVKKLVKCALPRTSKQSDK
mgnify:CR=1 FL=1